jgi:putative acetyltransferase
MTTSTSTSPSQQGQTPGSAGAAIRSERRGDEQAVWRVVSQAFGQPDEAGLVEALRQHGDQVISLVAELAGQIVGHIMFSPVTVRDDQTDWRAIGLGPLAVLPSHQGHGIGARLVWAGLEACRDAGHDVVFVLGHPGYYPRFGFLPTDQAGIRWEHDAPAEAFMVVELTPGAMAHRRGVLSFLPEFDQA